MTSVVRLVSKCVQAARTSTTGSELPMDDAQLWSLLIAEANYWSLVPIVPPGTQKTQLAGRMENQFPKEEVSESGDVRAFPANLQASILFTILFPQQPNRDPKTLTNLIFLVPP